MITLRSFIGKCILMLLAILLAATAALTPLQAKAQATGARSGSGAVVDARTPPPDDPPPDPPFNTGGFVSQSVPTTMTAGQSYIVTVSMINTGTKDWMTATGHKLGSTNPNDNGTWGGSRVPLANNVFHGQTAEFTFQVTAPGTPGSYNFQWQMLQEGVEWFGLPSNNVVVNVVPPPRVNGAVFAGQSVPATMTAGTTNTVSVSMINNGNTTWTSADAYRLGSRNPYDNGTWGIGRVDLPWSVAPGQTATFTFNVSAPATVGSYNFQWSMVQDGVEWFGPPSDNAVVNVVAPPTNGAAAIAMNVPSLTQGQQATISVTMQNTGNTTWPAGSNYKLGSKNPDENLIWGVQRVDLANDVAPGQQYTFTFPITAPAAGTYTMQWEMMQRYVQWFGGLASGSVTVSPPTPVDNVTYIHTDALGSPVARSDSAGNIISRTSYEPYGRTAGGVTPTIGFTGHVNDADTGLVYMQQRYYDPMAGRFLSVDPVTTDANTGGSFNRYAYGGNNPYKYVDPDGRNPLLLRMVYGASFAAATRLGAPILGGLIATAIWSATHPSPMASGTQGCIYCVPGTHTTSGDKYVGSTNDLDKRKQDKTDGRDRNTADVIDTYNPDDKEERRRKEQQAINDLGGVDNLDNRRNEIRESKWEDKGVKSPQKPEPKKPEEPKPPETK